MGLLGIDYYKSDQDPEIKNKIPEPYKDDRLSVNHNERDTL